MNGSQSRRASANGSNQDAALINLVNAGNEIDTIKSIEGFCKSLFSSLIICKAVY
jgi:hypothetical protein